MFISWKLINGLKKIEKAIFPVGKIQEKRVFPQPKKSCLYSSYFEPIWYLIGEKESFSAAKEIVDSPVIFEPMWYLIGEKEI